MWLNLTVVVEKLGFFLFRQVARKRKEVPGFDLGVVA